MDEPADSDVIEVNELLEEQTLENESTEKLSNQNRRWICGPGEGWFPSARMYHSTGHDIFKEGEDPYDTFMRRHLQHYGYFTGRNASFRNNYNRLEDWHRNYDLRLSGTQNLSVDEEQARRMGQYSIKNNADTNGQFFSEGQTADELLRRTTQLVFHYQAGRKIPKLREPRNLYALTKEPGPQQATRWPSHMQVICPSIRFLEYSPAQPDPLYTPSGKETTPAVRGTSSGELVYFNDPGRDIYFMRSRVAGCRLALRNMNLTPRDTVEEGNYTLEFESRFESGNLLKAVKVGDFEYELTLRPDLYTDRHTQWFFFRIRNMIPNQSYRLTIVNLMKPSSLYNHGMKPVFYSEWNAKKNKIGWIRAGYDIKYYRNNLGSMSGRTFYSLTWTMQFPFQNDTCYFAHCYPYTYTDLQEYLFMLANDPVRSRFCKQRVLCRTLAGNLVYILTITSPSRNPEIARSKKAVILTARVHPGETNASWMMKGFLDFLCGSSADAKLLRDNFIFKIVPMLNPDGVIVGNYRCSLSGRDLNRNYKSVLKDSFPSVWHVKMMAKKIHMEREIVLYCDLHGHSRKHNIFIYGCENKNNPQRKFRERIFPLMLSKNASNKFSYENCKFKVQKSKEGTGRVVMWYMGIMNSYTMEATFGGTSLGSRKGTHLSAHDLEEIGHQFCDTLLDYCDPDTSKIDVCYLEIKDRMRKMILKKLEMRNIQGPIDEVNLDEYTSELESDTSGSDSSCDDGLPVHLLAIAPKLQRKKKLKTRRDRNKQQTARKSAPPQEEAKPMPSQGVKSTDKQKAIRSSQTSSKRRDDHTHVSIGTNGTPSYSEDRCIERAAKKLNKVSVKYFQPMVGIMTIKNLERPQTASRSDYLEALTTAYIRSGVLMVPEQKDYSIRYTNGLGNKQESSIATQFLSSHLGNLSVDRDSDPDSGPLMRNAACQWSPQPEFFDNDSDNKLSDDTKDAILAEEQYEILRRSALRRQLSPVQQRVLAQRHLVAVAAMQQRREQTQRSLSAISEVCHSTSAIKQHPNPFDENESGDAKLIPSRSNSRCASAPQKQDVRQTPVLYACPTSFNPEDDENPASEYSTSNRKQMHEDSPNSSFKKTSATPAHAETLIAPKEDHNKTVVITAAILSKTAVQKSSVENFNSKSMQESVDEKNYNQHNSSNFSTQQESFALVNFHNSADENLDLQSNANLKQETNEQKFSGMLSTNGNYKLKDSTSSRSSSIFEKSSTPEELREKNLLSNPILVATGAETKDGDLLFEHTPSQSNANMSSKLETPLSGDDAFLEGIPKQWGGTKKPFTLEMKTEMVKTEPAKRERIRILSAKKRGITDIISEGHNNRYRARNYPTPGDMEGYFGMSDNVGPGTSKHQGRVPPVVANIAELRRSLMGQVKESKDEDNEKKNYHPNHASRNKHPHTTEDKLWDDRQSKRWNVNLRPKGQGKYFDIPSDERQSKHYERNPEKLDLHESEKESVSYNRKALKKGKKEKAGHYVNQILESMPEHIAAPANQVHSSSDYEEFIEEKWPLMTENDIRIYSQGNATIEKFTENSLTNIRFGSRTADHNKRLREQWIDVHQRPKDVVQGSRSDMLSMSSVSLNIEGDVEERPTIATPALARRPVPPLLRYLSAKQMIKKK